MDQHESTQCNMTLAGSISQFYQTKKIVNISQLWAQQATKLCLKGFFYKNIAGRGWESGWGLHLPVLRSHNMVALTSEGLRKAAQKLKAKSAYLYITSFQPSAIGVGHRRRPSASAIGVGHRPSGRRS